MVTPEFHLSDVSIDRSRGNRDIRVEREQALAIINLWNAASSFRSHVSVGVIVLGSK